jgi:hypothetical protein
VAAGERTRTERAATPGGRSRVQTEAPGAVAGARRADDNDPPGAIAKCKDGLYSHATHRRGACGHHGGVAQWLSGSE